MKKIWLNSGKRLGYKAVKRVLDVIFSAVLLLMLTIPMALIWLGVLLTSRGGGIFKQTRVGRGGKEFVCYKFRTMYKNAPSSVPSSSFEGVENFVTPIGKILRRTSLDELPQLFNVLRGDMSIVGPRPLIIEEKKVHRERSARGVYELRPGITGLSQISGRDELSDESKVELDAIYLQEFGILQDAKILAGTVFKVLTGDGIANTRKKRK